MLGLTDVIIIKLLQDMIAMSPGKRQWTTQLRLYANPIRGSRGVKPHQKSYDDDEDE